MIGCFVGLAKINGFNFFWTREMTFTSAPLSLRSLFWFASCAGDVADGGEDRPNFNKYFKIGQIYK